MSKSTKSTQESKPPEWAKPLFEQSAGVAQDLYKSGKGFNVYGGDRVADMSGVTRGGINTIGNAQAPNMGNIAGTRQLKDIAGGKYLSGGNPYFKSMLNNVVNDQTDQIKSMFSGTGRYGSGANQEVIGETAGDTYLKGMNDNYMFERGQMMDAGNTLANRQLQGFDANLRGGAAQIGAGQLLDAKKQQELDAKMRAFTERDNIDWTRLGALQAAASGSAGNYGTQVSTQRQPFNPFSLIGALGAMM